MEHENVLVLEILEIAESHQSRARWARYCWKTPTLTQGKEQGLTALVRPWSSGLVHRIVTLADIPGRIVAGLGGSTPDAQR